MAQQPGLADRLERGEDVQIFDVPLQQITQVVFPWYYFSGGAIVVVGSVRYRLSFLEPQNAKWPEPRTHDVIKAAVKVAELCGEIAEGRDAGKAWKTALLGQKSTG
jgi:hypothetical protein